jgi:hypothetical protein
MGKLQSVEFYQGEIEKTQGQVDAAESRLSENEQRLRDAKQVHSRLVAANVKNQRESSSLESQRREIAKLETTIQELQEGLEYLQAEGAELERKLALAIVYESFGKRYRDETMVYFGKFENICSLARTANESIKRLKEETDAFLRSPLPLQTLAHGIIRAIPNTIDIQAFLEGDVVDDDQGGRNDSFLSKVLAEYSGMVARLPSNEFDLAALKDLAARLYMNSSNWGRELRPKVTTGSTRGITTTRPADQRRLRPEELLTYGADRKPFPIPEHRQERKAASAA